METVVSAYDHEIDVKTALNDESISQFQANINTAASVFETLSSTPYEWTEAMTDPVALKQSFTEKVEAAVPAKISEEQALKMKAAIDDAFSFNPTVLASKEEMIYSINTQLALEIANKKMLNDGLNTTRKMMIHYGSETVRRLKGISTVDALTKTTVAAESITSAIGKFEQGGALNVVSGVVDITSAVATILPPPASIVTETLSGILGIFMPGAGGPSNQDVINAISQEFADQKIFIEEQFAEQQKFIKEQFEEAITNIQDFQFQNELSAVLSHSTSLLDDLQIKQAYLFSIDDEVALTAHELTRVTAELNLLDDTKDTSIIREYFKTYCLDNAIMKNPIQDSSQEVQMCLIILYNYFTIEKYRDMLLVRFLSIRNLEDDTSEVTEAYWAVQAERKSQVLEFINEIEANAGDGLQTFEDEYHTYMTGKKIRCYIAGDVSGQNYASLELQQQLEIQEYIKAVKGTSEDYSNACTEAADLRKL